jgi:vacuolar-type H+-ATPase subunit H
VIPVEGWLTTFRHLVDDRWHIDKWQTLITGLLALGAAVGTILATRATAHKQIDAARQQADKQIDAAREQADKQIAAAREEADRVIDAARNQTKVTADQTATTVRLERERVENEDRAFRAVLEAAMARVLTEAAWARKTYPALMTQLAGSSVDSSVEARIVRQCITKSSFTELRAACIRQGSALTGDFLDLEREIDNFASQVVEQARVANETRPVGKHAGVSDQLAVIEDKAAALRKAAKGTG